MIVGYLGESMQDGILFQVSKEKVETPSNMKWSGSARWGTHERHLTHALTEFTGLDPDSFSFDMLLTAELGVDPMEEVAKLWRYEREGTPVALTIGTHAYGKYRWSVVSHSVTVEYTDAHGELYAVKVSVNLQEYLSEKF